MKILVINSGSSSIKFKLFEMDKDLVLIDGIVEEIGNKNSKIKFFNADKNQRCEKYIQIPDHKKAIELVDEVLEGSGFLNSFEDLSGIGHRIVHGGEYFKSSVILDKNSIKLIKDLVPLAPLHNPGHLMGIESTMLKSSKVPNIAVFDTVFHQSIPKKSYLYAIPYEYYKEFGVRKYGFHGTSHSYVSKKASQILNIPKDNFNAISLHLGNGASACAIKSGKSIDTSMGISPLEGLMMGTRSGDIDPAAIFYIASQTGKTMKDMDEILNKKSGILGIASTNDMREIIKKIDEKDSMAILAYEMYIHRLLKYIGAYYVILGHVDAIIFTAGIGENMPKLRSDVCNNLKHLGVKIDENLNSHSLEKSFKISTIDSKISCLVINTNEELEIANEVKKLIN